jgi:hypothetical protein
MTASPSTPSTPTSLVAKIAALPQLTMPELWRLWDKHFAQRPAHHHRTYLESRLAYKLQEDAYGSLKPVLRRKLEHIGQTGQVPGHDKGSAHLLVAGTVLVREFNGIEHRVRVMDDARFDYQGQPYKSLSAVARVITGTAWSGPVFFGLKTTTRNNTTGRAI